ncbi:LamG domain-containing protein [Nocardioides luteus]|nr:LamG domain-containing protein [Nocardioides luteus]
MTDPGVTDAGVSVGFELPLGLGVAKVEDVANGSGAGESSVGSRVSWPVLDAGGSPIVGARLLASVEPDASGMVPVLRVDSPDAFKAVESAAAAAGSDQVAFEMTLKGAQWKPEPDGAGPDGVASDGTLQAVNPEGEVVLVSPVARQWDAAGSESTAAESGSRTKTSGSKSSGSTSSGTESSDSASASKTASEAAAADRAGAPLSGDEVALMRTKVAANGRSFTAAVDEAMVNDDRTSWPLHFDPAATNSRSEWTMIESALPSSSSGYKFSSDNGTGVGRCVYGVAAECNRTTTKRLIWEFGGLGEFTVLEPRELISASFSAYGTHSYSCTDKMVKSYRMADLTSTSTWNSHAGYFTSDREMGNRTLHHKSGCPTGPKWVEFNVLAGAKQKVEWNDDTFSIGLAAADTSSMAGWKRYRWDAKLEVEYNRAPNTPTSLSTDSRGCVTGSTRPLLNEPTVLLSASASDPDGDLSRVRFTLQKYVSGAWSTTWTSGYTTARSGSPHTTSGLGMPSLATATYRWRATAYDDPNIAKLRPNDVPFGSTPSAWCEFGVDRTDPGAPVVTALQPSEDSRVQAVYDDPDLDLGGVGKTGCFKITRGANSSDVVKYEYQFSNQASVTTVSSTSSSIVVCWAPTVANTGWLKAWTVDKALNKSTQGTANFTVATAREDGIWSFDDVDDPGRDVSVKDAGEQTPAGSLVLDGVDHSVKGPHGAFGARDDDYALGFSGSADEDVHSEAQVVDTTQSFVVSAHVKLDDAINPNKWTSILSQEYNGNDVIRLAYRPHTASTSSTAACPSTEGTGCWVLLVKTSSNTWKQVSSARAAKIGEWVHLTAEYDKGAVTNQADDTLRLWTCNAGTPDAPRDAEVVRADASFTGPLALPRGELYIGHSHYLGEPADHIKGVIDNIRVFKGDVLAEAKVRRMCQGAEAWQGQDEDKFLNPTQN